MAATEGIHFENDTNGNPVFIRIDLATYGDRLEPFLIEVGVMEKEEKFDRQWQKGIVFDEILSRTRNH